MKSFMWCTVTVDEGHRLKNAQSRLYAALDQLRTASRLLLTGTPLQNNLAELFHLMHFIEPGKFPDLAAFTAEYADLSTDSQVKRLHGMLADHLLRRVKKDVLTQLPPKREQLVRVELSEQQRTFYKQILVRQFPALAGGSSTGAGALKNVMMELRKCCNHPLLFSEEGEIAAATAAATEELVRASGKLELLDRMMPHFKEQVRSPPLNAMQARAAPTPLPRLALHPSAGVRVPLRALVGWWRVRVAGAAVKPGETRAVAGAGQPAAHIQPVHADTGHPASVACEARLGL